MCSFGQSSVALVPRRAAWFLACIFILFASREGFAQRTIHVPGDAQTIQAGIDAADGGDTVVVAPGTYFENIDFKGKAITVTSTLSIDPTTIAAATAATIIDGSSTGPAVTFKTSESRAAVLQYFTIQNGGNFNDVNPARGGLVIDNSSPSILNNIINRNNCWSIYATLAGPLIKGNTISATQDPSGNCSSGAGAAIYLEGDFAAFHGPLTEDLPATVLGNVLEDNVESGLEAAAGNGGAGIAVWAGSPIIADNIIRNNASPGGSGGAINIEYGSGVVILQNLIYGNSAGCGGGALAFQGGPGMLNYAVLIANNTIVDNIYKGPGGASNCINIAQIYPDPGQYGMSNDTEVFVNNIISGSTSDPAINCSQFGGGTEVTQPTFDHNLLYNSGGAFFGNFCIDTSAKYGNVTKAPQFKDAEAHDYRLVPVSPGIDAGNNSVLLSLQTLIGSAVTTDFLGAPRLQDATNQGYPIIDIGAYELTGRNDSAPTTIYLIADDGYIGSAGSGFTLIANLASALGVPTGTVDFYFDDARLLGTSAIANGVATLLKAPFTPGIHSIYAYYPGVGSFSQATSIVSFVSIAPYTSTLTIASNLNPSVLGQSVTFTISASSSDPSYNPSPIKLTDTLTNSLLATLTPDSAGVATYTTSTLVLGSHGIYADSAGDAEHSSAEGFVDQQVISGTATTTALTSSLNPANAGQSVTVTATVSSSDGTPTGLITFTDGNSTLGTATLVNGIAAYTTSTLAVGTHPIAAAYNPTGTTFNASNAALSQVINGLPTSTALTITPISALYGATITMSASVASSGAPVTGNGTVTFMDGATRLGTSILAASPPVASFATSSLTVGTHIISATYSGDATHSVSTSAPVTVTITAATTSDFSLKSNPPTLSVQAGDHTTFSVTASSVGGFAGTLSFSNGTLPMYVTLVATPDQIQLSSGSEGTVSCYLDTGGVPGNLSQRQVHGRSEIFSLAAISPICLLLLARVRSGRRCSSLLGAVLAMGLLASMMGCGSKFYTRYPSVAPGSYTLQITARDSPGLTHTLSIPLTITAR